MSQTTIVDDHFVAFRLRYELERQGTSQAQLARDLVVTDNWVSRRLRGEVPITAVELAQIAQYLGVQITVFFPPEVTGVAA